MSTIVKKEICLSNPNFIKIDGIYINKNHILYFNEYEIYLTNNTRVPIDFNTYEILLKEILYD